MVFFKNIQIELNFQKKCSFLAELVLIIHFELIGEFLFL